MGKTTDCTHRQINVAAMTPFNSWQFSLICFPTIVLYSEEIWKGINNY